MKQMIPHTSTVLKVLTNDDVEVQLASVLVVGNLARTGNSFILLLLIIILLYILLHFINVHIINFLICD